MDIMKYLLIESVPAIVKEKKDKPVKVDSTAKTLGGLGGGFMASTERYGLGKALTAADKGVTKAALPKIMGKMGRFGTSKIGSRLGRAAAWTAGRGLGSWGLGGAAVFGAGSLLGRGLVGAGEKINRKFKRKPQPGATLRNA